MDINNSTKYNPVSASTQFLCEGMKYMVQKIDPVFFDNSKSKMTHEEIAELVGAYGWLPMESRNVYMISFWHEEEKARMNVYFTTMTVTIEGNNRRTQVYRKVDTDRLEDILIGFNKKQNGTSN